MVTSKRFIAGAVCPSCRQMDKLVVYRENQETIKECVSCGQRETMDALGRPAELSTRVNRPADNNEQVVELIDPSKLH